MLPVHMKYILYAAGESKDIFAQRQEKEEEQEAMDAQNKQQGE